MITRNLPDFRTKTLAINSKIKGERDELIMGTQKIDIGCLLLLLFRYFSASQVLHRGKQRRYVVLLWLYCVHTTRCLGRGYRNLPSVHDTWFFGGGSFFGSKPWTEWPDLSSASHHHSPSRHLPKFQTSRVPVGGLDPDVLGNRDMEGSENIQIEPRSVAEFRMPALFSVLLEH